MAGTEYILNQAYGYCYILILGAAFAGIMILISYVLAKYMNQVQNSERFTTANRNVSSGLISSAVVSSWVWPGTLLTSSLWGYTYGISGGYFYSMGGLLHLTAFTQLAIEIKRIAPGAHTVAEIVKVRYNKWSHFVYLFYIGATNVMIASCLLLGASQGFHAATGIHVVAANFLIPIFVCAYTMFGGLKATFLSDWIHTVIIYVIILTMFFKLLCTSDIVGSPGKLYDMILESEEKFPSTVGTSFLSFKSKKMFMSTWSVCIGGFSNVFGDPSYAQKAIAAEPKSIFHGYIVGGACWMVVPWCLGIIGLACRALLVYPEFITYPNALSSTEANSGLALIYSMGTILGKSGAAAGVLLLFMSVTSALSAELIAFSSIFTYDIYRGYINPNASGKQLVTFAHSTTFIFGLFVGCVSVIFNYIGVTVGWLITFYGIILLPAASILAYSLFYSKTSDYGIIIGAPMSTLGGIACWIAAAYTLAGGKVDKNTLMTPQATIVGNFVTFGLSIVLIPGISWIKPQSFDFSALANAFDAADDADEDEIQNMHIGDRDDDKTLKRASWIAFALNVFIVVGGYLIVPCAFYGTDYKFSKKYFSSWVIIICICLLAASIYIIIYPLYENYDSFIELYHNYKNHKVFTEAEKMTLEDNGSDNSPEPESEAVVVEEKA